MTDITALLACPRCDQALPELTCSACRVTFPVRGGIAWLFADPGAAMSDWKNRWQLALEHLQADLARVEHSLGRAPRGSTGRRLKVLADGYRRQRECLEHILQPLALAPGGSMETLLALRTRLPPCQGIFSYEANVHRDWCWGERENQAAVDAVLRALGEHRPRRVLVLGAGAGRLAYDLHQQTEAKVTVALDLNPLLVYVGARVSAGETVDLVEFPLAPREPSAAAIPRILQAPGVTRPGLEFLLADAGRPPFRKGSFDVVVTPWLLDVMDSPLATTLPRINGLLAADGLWINQGSVAFEDPDPAERLTLAELLELAADCGFDDLSAVEEETVYMNCPDSRHGRTEIVATLRARKASSVDAPLRHESLPDWIVRGRSPVPALPAFRRQAMTTRMHAFIMTLIDGRRSLKDIAALLEQQQLMSRQEAETALRGFFVKMYDEARRAGGPPG